jgi:hypothetical protein
MAASNFFDDIASSRSAGGQRESRRGILHRAKVHLPDSIPGEAGAKNPGAPAVKLAAEEDWGR